MSDNGRILALRCGCEFTGTELTFMCPDADDLLDGLLAALDALAYAEAVGDTPAARLAVEQLQKCRVHYAWHFRKAARL